MDPQYVTVLLPIPRSQSTVVTLFTFFYGMQTTVEDPESKALLLEFASILGDFLPEAMAEEIRQDAGVCIGARIDGLQAIAGQMVDRITHLPPDEPAQPGTPGVEFF